LGRLGPLLRFIDPYSVTDITNRRVSVEKLRINHYPVKSREEFERKARFKREKKRYDSIDYFAYHDRNDVLDPILSRYLPALEAVLDAHRDYEARGARQHQARARPDGGLTVPLSLHPRA
jgi:hypothetical protein